MRTDWCRSIVCVAFIAVSALVSTDLPAQVRTYGVTVAAGPFDRDESIVSFSLPDELAPGLYMMRGSDSDSVIVQVDHRNRGWFLLSTLPAGSSRTYDLVTEAIDLPPRGADVTRRIDENTIAFRSAGREVLRYLHGTNDPPPTLDERYRRGGYIHPVYSPEGVRLTGHLGSAHPHHSGIWSAWTHTRFEGRTPDFWNVHLDSGRVDQVGGLEMSWEGPVHGGFQAYHQFIDLTGQRPTVALNEEWEVRIYPYSERGRIHVFDLELTQAADTDRPLVLPEYLYGGVGFRGHEDWDDPDNASFLTSEGLGRDGHGTRPRWTHVGGRTDDRLAGVTILGHPDNVRHPQPVRIHPTEPFFNFAPTQLGEMSIRPGTPYVARYRYVTSDGEPDPEMLERLWNDYAYPPAVWVAAR